MYTRAQHQERQRQWAEFHRWEAVNLAPERPLDAVLADIDWLSRCLPEEVRRADPDPEKLGIQKLRGMMARW